MDQFIKVGTAGEGTYGIVYKAKNKITGKFVALKKIKLERNRRDYEGVPSTAIREICLLKGLRHSNIVELLDVICVDTDLYLVFEFLDTDLKKYTDNLQQSMSEDLIKNYMRQIIEGVNYLHTYRILHRDLKPQNLLLDKEGHIKLADFGLSRTFALPTRTYTHEVVTLWYRAPELLLGTKLYCTGVDMWSVGCIMAEMITRQALFPGDSEIDQLYKIFKLMGTPSEKEWAGISRLPNYKANFPSWNPQPVSKSEALEIANSEAKQFLDKILVYEPRKRLTADEALKHDFLQNVRLTPPDLDCFPKSKSQ